MAHEYSWETGSTYTPPRREGLGWYVLVAVVLALAIHVGALIAASSTFYKAEISEPQEWESQPMRVTNVETEPEPIAEAPPEEELERPIDDSELIDNTEDAIAELQNTEIDIDTQIEEAALPEMKIEKPKLTGVEEGELLKPVIGADVNPDIPDPGQMKIDFPMAKANQLVVVDDGAPLADVLDPNSVVAELGQMKGAGGDSENGVIEGYTGLSAYAKMSPGDLQRNKASIGSDLLFAFNESTLRDDARLTLMTVAMLIDRNPGMYCWVEGHTDLIGGDDFNRDLSLKRGQAVKDWLVRALQLDPKYIVVRPFGRTSPIVMEGDRDQQAPNRRVDIKMRKSLPVPVGEVPAKVLVKPGKAFIVPDDEAEIPTAELVPEEPDEIPKAELVPDDEAEIPGAIPVTE
jgi:OmpA-OmpF porin, OOP family